jgi:acetyl-CoA C-acetyltransferase
MRRVLIAGVGMVPFRKPGQSDPYDVMGAAAACNALADAGIAYTDVRQAYAGYVYADSCAGQAALYRVGITGIPIFNVNNNCGSGSSAFYLAAQAVACGAVDCALAVGFEQMQPGALGLAFPDKTNPLDRHIRAVGGLMGLAEEELSLPPAVMLFGCQTERLLDETGMAESTLAQIAIKARRHAAANENAIFRTPLTLEQILDGPPLYRGVRKLYACPPSCGAAAVVVCNDEFARRHGIRTDIRLIGQGACSDHAEFFTGDAQDVISRGITRATAQQAYASAGIGPEDIDVIELHDCFVSNEILTYAGLGLCGEQDLEKFVLDGDNTYGGKVVVNPSGGLLAKGHPLGATGLAQITELVWQLRGQAGPRQVEGARTALQHNGGLGSAGFVNILQRV